ncbi:MAG: hypothetical protein AAFO79_04195 [Pseudomonadota bacterium]
MLPARTAVRLVRFDALSQADAASVRADVREICVATAAPQVADTLSAPDARAAFLERWLERYLDRWADYAFVAAGPDPETGARRAVGYIVGCPRPIPDAVIPFAKDAVWRFADQLPLYPAHLHINCAASARGRGLGKQLKSALVARLRADNNSAVRGLHAITAQGSANNHFYRAAGLTEIGPRSLGATPLLLYGERW